MKLTNNKTCTIILRYQQQNNLLKKQIMLINLEEKDGLKKT